MFNNAYSNITNKDDLTKENTRTKQVLKEKRYQENTTTKVAFLRELFTITVCLSHSKKQATNIQEEDIKMSINLSYVKS